MRPTATLAWLLVFAGCDLSVIPVIALRDASMLDASGDQADMADVAVPPCSDSFIVASPVAPSTAVAGPRADWVGTHLLVVWREADGIRTQRWSASGEALGPAVVIPNTAASTVPTLLTRADGGYLVAYATSGAVYLQSIDADGEAVSPRVTVSERVSIDVPSAEIAAHVHGDGGVSMVWADGRHGDRELYFGGVDASMRALPERRITNAPGRSYQCRIAPGDGGTALLWSDGRTGDDELRFLRLDRLGDAIGPETEPVPRAGFDGDPRFVALEDGYLLVHVHESNVYVTRLDSAGTALVDTVPLDVEDDLPSFDPNVFRHGGGVFVVWQDRRHGDLELYLARLDLNGTVVERGERLTNAPGNSEDAQFVDVAGSLQLIWSDARGGSSAPYHGRLPCLE